MVIETYDSTTEEGGEVNFSGDRIQELALNIGTGRMEGGAFVKWMGEKKRERDENFIILVRACSKQQQQPFCHNSACITQ